MVPAEPAKAGNHEGLQQKNPRLHTPVSLRLNNRTKMIRTASSGYPSRRACTMPRAMDRQAFWLTGDSAACMPFLLTAPSHRRPSTVASGGVRSRSQQRLVCDGVSPSFLLTEPPVDPEAVPHLSADISLTERAGFVNFRMDTRPGPLPITVVALRITSTVKADSLYKPYSYRFFPDTIFFTRRSQ